MRKLSINKSVTFFGALVLTFLLVKPLKAIEMPPNIQTYLQKATVTEVGFPSGTEQQRTEFTTWLTANWSAVLSDIETVAPDERRQKVVVAGAEFLSSTDYVSFLSGWLDKYQAGKVTKAAAIGAILADGKKSGFLAFNYQHQTVINLCNQVKSIFTNEAAVQGSMNEVLSGAQKRQAALAAFNEGRPEPEILPAP
jgi:hypothetical protein